VAFSGRFHHDLAYVSAEEGDHRESNVRRLRLGPRITLFEDWLFHAEVELNPQERDPLYVRFTDFYLEWSGRDGMAVTAGKQSVPFTLEGSTSSRQLLTIDRSNLANNVWFPQEYMPGMSVSGEPDGWRYQVGIFSAGAENRVFGEFSGGPFVLGVVGYDLAEKLHVGGAELVGNYVYQHPDADNSFTRALQHVGSIHLTLDEPAWGLRADLSLGFGYHEQSDLVGGVVMPFVNLMDNLQIVGRYTAVTSEDANGVRFGTYENRIDGGRGDRYDEAYLGVNYYFYEHRLKLQTGLHYANMHDAASDGGAYTGLGFVTGLRIGW
jgi:phosphate-selective porin OprO/OprP